jgi:hypothetical protein
MPEDHIGRFLSDQDRRYVRIAAYDGWHDGRRPPPASSELGASRMPRRLTFDRSTASRVEPTGARRRALSFAEGRAFADELLRQSKHCFVSSKLGDNQRLVGRLARPGGPLLHGYESSITTSPCPAGMGPAYKVFLARTSTTYSRRVASAFTARRILTSNNRKAAHVQKHEGIVVGAGGVDALTADVVANRQRGSCLDLRSM